MINGTGWTWAEVRAMKIKDWLRLTDYWRKHPPACEVLEILAGGVAPKVSRPSSEEEIRRVVDLANGGA